MDGSLIGQVEITPSEQIPAIINNSKQAYDLWKTTPAPVRGELLRLLGEELRSSKEELAKLVTLECGKIYQEALGEVQEMIDICDFAVGLSRQLYGLTIASERPGHSMRETWHPLGPCCIITAFNFPVAVWAWNASLALVCGNSLIWKPSEKTPLTALACQEIFERALQKFAKAPDHLSQIVIGTADTGSMLVDSPDIPLVSATGSTVMGRLVGPRVAERFGKSILELGGNNAMIVAPSADLAMAERAITFSAVGTCGQRCTSLRRLIVHDEVYDQIVPRLKSIYENIKIGDPLNEENLIGPLIDQNAFLAMQNSLRTANADGAIITGGKRINEETYSQAFYVTPALVEVTGQNDLVRQETFAPILYIMRYRELDEAIAIQNDVPQGLSSCIFSTDIRECEYFISSAGSDCGIANVNIGTSGAEIGGAFGGEKETGGGRESGSDAWKGYMRRQTSTINFASDLPLAQGIKFDV